MICTHATASITTRGGGIPEALRQLVCAQTVAGLTIKVVGFADQGTALAGWPTDSLQGLVPTSLPGFPWASGFATALATTGPRVLHTHGLWQQPSVVVPKVARAREIPWVVSPHGMLDPWALSHSRWKKRLAAALFENHHLRGAACLHALCQAEADAMRAYELKNPIAVIPNGVELPEERNQRSGSRGQETGRKTLLFLGRLHPKKGLPNALRAWKQALHSTSNIQHSKFQEWQFVVAGWDQGGHEAELKHLCKDLGLAYAETAASDFTDNRQPTTDNGASVVFVGPAFGDTKDALLRGASAFILPSFSEGLPMSVLEAWAYRLPVMMTEHCNLPEGFAADAAVRIGTDTESIAEGMRLLTCSPSSDLCSLGINGRALVERQFTWAQVAARMNAVYQWILGVGEPPVSLHSK